jgi:multiple sugar transport system ATP-binding protein
MRKGVLQQEGPPETIYGEPRNLFVAAFIGSPGMNFLRGVLRDEPGGIVCRLRSQDLVLPAQVVSARPALRSYVGRELAIGIRPEHLIVDTADRPTLKTAVLRSEMLGAERLLHVSVEADPVVTDEMVEAAADVDATAVTSLQDESAERRVTLIARVDPTFGVPVGSPLELAVKADCLHFFDLDTGGAIT